MSVSGSAGVVVVVGGGWVRGGRETEVRRCHIPCAEFERKRGSVSTEMVCVRAVVHCICTGLEKTRGSVCTEMMCGGCALFVYRVGKDARGPVGAEMMSGGCALFM